MWSRRRVILPSVNDDDQRVPGLRYGDPRVMALFAASAMHFHLPDGFSNRMLRGRVAALQGKSSADDRRGRMTDDLRRLRLKGLIQRLEGTHRYVVTPPGRRLALLFAKSHARILRRGLARLDVGPPDDARDPLVKAWHCLDREIDRLIEEADTAA